MNDEQLARTLQSVGQTCFVRFFGEFSSKTLSREDIIEKLKSETSYTEGSCISRTSHARRIFSSGLSKKALETVISSDSPKVSEEIKEQARRWLKLLEN